ncbi:MAG: response regulator [Clostridia bacterium]|nr:response regulator [Clostridia bacterium]
MTQQELADMLHVTRSALAKWEKGIRMPDIAMLSRLGEILGVDFNMLLAAAAQNDEGPNVIMVDDVKPIVLGALPVLEEVMPNATVTGFTRVSDAIEYAKANRVALAFLDIELGSTSGLELCRTLLEIHPRTNVVYLTAYKDFALDAWGTGACGFMVKPLTSDGVREQLTKLRYPFRTGGEDK